MTLKGKLILLTGASGGIGQAIARRLAAQGARLILVGRSTEQLNVLARELRVLVNEGFVLQADITQHSGRETIRTALLALQEPLDALINCAGVNLFGFLEDSDPDTVAQLINTNVTATILLTQLTLPFLHKSTGRILNIGSSFGSLGYPGFSVYCASKFALRGFSEALRRELGDSNIQVAHLAPRATNTSLNSDAVCAMNRELGNAMDEPDIVAAQVEIMLSAKRMRDRNVGWPERLFLRINSIVPRIIDNALRGQLPIIRRYAQRIPDAGVATNTISTRLS
ncbi:SDR family oxidoreductase [Cellvibrio sp. pealriver]|uniref:SDR family oxidoreductase n=1 Tax=Cellvibrio sp. pealriver TaxID=1622269 RepID=UPI00066FD70C|nr:SDR family oxidoreductase [Cellvibrio sp. pealriver]